METPAGDPSLAIEPMLSIADLARVLRASRRTVESMRAAGKLPVPDCHAGKMPRWHPATIRAWSDSQGKRS